MSYTSLNYTKAIRLYKRNATAIIRVLPKGCVRKANYVLSVFLATEQETLRNWYNGLLLHSLSEADYRQLLKSERTALSFSLFKENGIQPPATVEPKQQWLHLLEEDAIQCSGVAFGRRKKRHKVRLYKLPEALPVLSTWSAEQQSYLAN